MNVLFFRLQLFIFALIFIHCKKEDTFSQIITSRTFLELQNNYRIKQTNRAVFFAEHLENQRILTKGMSGEQLQARNERMKAYQAELIEILKDCSAKSINKADREAKKQHLDEQYQDVAEPNYPDMFDRDDELLFKKLVVEFPELKKDHLLYMRVFDEIKNKTLENTKN